MTIETTDCTASAISRTTKVHRHLMPEFSPRDKKKLADKSILHRRFFNRIDNYNAKKDQYITALRIITKQRSIRSEQCETLRELRYALVKHCSYDIHGDLEVTAPVEEIAREIGQLYEYDNGRVSLDPVYAALETLHASQQIIWVREFSYEKNQHKAGRIFLLPNFFVAMGLDKNTTRDIISDFLKNRKKGGELLPKEVMQLNRLKKVSEKDLAGMKKWQQNKLDRTTRRLLKNVAERTSGEAEQAAAALSIVRKRIKSANENRKAEKQQQLMNEHKDKSELDLKHEKVQQFLASKTPLEINLAKVTVRKLSPGISGKKLDLAVYNYLNKKAP